MKDRIPFDRALDFANKEKITESLYPLFVHNIGALLYHPTNQSRTNAVMAAADRRRLDTTKQQGGMVGPAGSQPPSLTHHHSMNSAQQPHSIAPHPGVGRPGLDRAHTFPTPPTSASSTSVGLNNQGSSYDWSGQNMGNGVQSSQPLILENHAHSTPATPATTPPGSTMPSLQPYQSHQSYDSSRPMYSAAAQQQAQYASQHNVQQQNLARGAPLQSSTYGKQDMGPPATRAPGSRTDSEHGDIKHDPYAHSQGNEQVGHGTGEEEAEHEHDSEYPHDNNNAYAAHRGSYQSYGSAPNLATLHGEHSQTASAINGSPSHQNGSGRVTPRDPNGSQPQWATGYHTPPRAPPSSNLYNPMSDARGSVPNGSSGAEHYPTAPLQSPYAPTQTNGIPPSTKRMREDDDYHSRPSSRSDDIDAMKRRKIGREGSGASAAYGSDIKSITNPSRTIAAPRVRR